MINEVHPRVLSLLTPATNKALNVLLQHATQEQRSALDTTADLKTLMASLFDEAKGAGRSNGALLQLLRQTPVFREMGSFAGALTQLVQQLKAEGMVSPHLDALAQFSKQMAAVDSGNLKAQVANSGVFLESKLSTAIDTKTPLLTLLDTIASTLKKSALPESKGLHQQLLILKDQLAAHPDVRLPQQMAGQVMKLYASLQNVMQQRDITATEAFENAQQQLSRTMLPASVSALKTLRGDLENLHAMMLQSRTPQSGSTLGLIEKLVSLLQQVQKGTQTPEVLAAPLRELHSALSGIQTDPIHAKAMHRQLTSLQYFSKPEAFEAQHIMHERIAKDVKANLLSLTHEIESSTTPNRAEWLKGAERLLLQIDYYQLVSHLGNASTLYIPFEWDQLEEGSLSISKSKNKKFYCDIRLQLQDHGPLRVMLSLFEENQITIHAFSDSDSLKDGMREGVGMLREALHEAGLMLREIRFFKMPNEETSPYASDADDAQLGFEVKV